MSRALAALSAWLLIAALLVGCAAPAAPSPTAAPAKQPAAAPTAAPAAAPAAPAPTSAPAKAAAPEVKPFVLKLAHQNSPASPIHKEPMETFMANAEKRSNGRIKFEYYPAEQLVKAAGGLEAILNGVADIEVSATSYHAEAYPMANLWTLPLAHSSAAESFKSFQNLRAQYVQSEIDKLGVKLLAPYIGSAYVLFSAEKPVRKLEDLKGLRVRSPGSEVSKMLSKIGAQPVSMAAADMYEAVQKRTLDVAAHSVGYLAETVKIYETTKTGHLIDAGGLGTFVAPIIMNKASWERLGPELQKILEEEAIEMGRKISTNYDEVDVRGLKTMQEKGVTHIVFDAAQKETVKKLAYEVWDEAAKKLDSQGHPATKLLDEFRAGK